MWYKERVKAYFIKHPYALTLRGIQSRCKKNGAYGKFNVKNYLSKEDLKFLWERDNASLMKRPSIDRIDTYGNYTLVNCRYLELRENQKRPKRFSHRIRLSPDKWAMKYDKCIKCGTTKRKHMAKGRCINCYAKYIRGYE